MNKNNKNENSGITIKFAVILPIVFIVIPLLSFAILVYPKYAACKEISSLLSLKRDANKNSIINRYGKPEEEHKSIPIILSSPNINYRIHDKDKESITWYQYKINEYDIILGFNNSDTLSMIAYIID